jgi:hypothetical protein
MATLEQYCTHVETIHRDLRQEEFEPESQKLANSGTHKTSVIDVVFIIFYSIFFGGFGNANAVVGFVINTLEAK